MGAGQDTVAAAHAADSGRYYSIGCIAAAMKRNTVAASQGVADIHRHYYGELRSHDAIAAGRVRYYIDILPAGGVIV